MTVRVFARATGPGSLVLPADESHYLVRVRRVRVGTAIEVLDPAGGGWHATVTFADSKRAQVELEAPLPARPPWAIDLAVGLTDAKAAYDVVARATESGARSLTFVQTQRCQPARLNDERIERVVAASRRQCGRVDPLQIHTRSTLHTWLDVPRQGFVASFAPAPAEATRHHELSMLIGPEGGLTAEEERLAANAGLLPLSLGPFILRTEVAVTAAVAVAAKIAMV